MSSSIERIRDLRRFWLYLRQKVAIDYDWAKRHRRVYAINPAYANPCPHAIEHDHMELWRPIRRSIRLDTMRICANISGKLDIRFVPEELFACEIERSLSSGTWASGLGHKSFYERFFPPGIFPRFATALALP